MPTEFQFRRYSAAEIATKTGKEGEIFIDTDNWIIKIQDGITAGGQSASIDANVPFSNVTGAVSTNTNLQTALDAKLDLDLTGLTAKTSVVDDDILILADSAASNTTKKITRANLFASIDSSISTLTSLTNVSLKTSSSAEISGLSPKTTPIDTDVLLIEDSENGFAKKYIEIGDLPSDPYGSGGGGGLSSVADDTAPELGGNLDIGSNNITGSGIIDITGKESIIRFHYDDTTDFPNATTYHGAIAHSHADGAMYFAHGGSWNKLSNDGHSHSTSDITSGTFADARISETSVTQYQSSLSITESQIYDFGTYITASSTTSFTNKTFSDHITVAEIAAPGTPSSGFGAIYAKTDGKLYFKDDSGTETDLTAGGGGGSGTVTSVAVSGSDGIEVDSGSPITTSGTIALGIDANTLRSTLNVENGATGDQSDSEIETAYNNQVTAMNQATAETGTSTTIQRVTAQRIRQNVDASQAAITAITLTIDGGGSAISSGNTGKYPTVPYSGTIESIEIAADQIGSIVVDIQKGTTIAGLASICSSTKPTLSTAQRATDSTLTSWTTSISAGDILGFNVDSATTVTSVVLTIKVKKA